MKRKFFFYIYIVLFYISVLYPNTIITSYKSLDKNQNSTDMYFTFKNSTIILNDKVLVKSIPTEVATNMINTGYKKIAPIVYDSENNSVNGIEIGISGFVVRNDILYAPENSLSIYGPEKDDLPKNQKPNPNRWTKFYNNLRLEENDIGSYNIKVDKIINRYYVKILYPDEMSKAQSFNKDLSGEFVLDGLNRTEIIDIIWDNTLQQHYFDLWTKKTGTITVNQLPDWDIVIEKGKTGHYDKKSKNKEYDSEHTYTIKKKDLLFTYTLKGFEGSGNDEEDELIKVLYQKGFILNFDKEVDYVYKGEIDNNMNIVFPKINIYLTGIVEEVDDLDIHPDESDYKENYIIKYLTSNRDKLRKLPTIADGINLINTYNFEANVVLYDGTDIWIDKLTSLIKIDHYEETSLNNDDLVLTPIRSLSTFNIDINTNSSFPPLKGLYGLITNDSKKTKNKRIDLIYNDTTKLYEFNFETLESFNVRIFDKYDRLEKVDDKQIQVKFNNKKFTTKKIDINVKKFFDLKINVENLTALNILENYKFKLNHKNRSKQQSISQNRKNKQSKEIIFRKLNWENAPFTLFYDKENPVVTNMDNFKITTDDINSIDEEGFINDELIMYEFKDNIIIKITNANDKPYKGVVVTLIETVIDNYNYDDKNLREAITSENGNCSFKNVIDYKNAKIEFENPKNKKLISKSFNELERLTSTTYQLKL